MQIKVYETECAWRCGHHRLEVRYTLEQSFATLSTVSIPERSDVKHSSCCSSSSSARKPSSGKSPAYHQPWHFRDCQISYRFDAQNHVMLVTLQRSYLPCLL